MFPQGTLTSALRHLSRSIQLMASSCFSDGVRLHRRKFRLYHPYLFFTLRTYFYFGGESGIRTHGCFHIAGFQDRCLQPLGHLSVFPAAGSAYGGVIVFTRLRPQ